MKIKPPSVRIIAGALVGLLIAPLYAGAVTVPQTLKVAMTAYNAVPEQTSSHPNVTASGAFSNPTIVAARSQDLAGELPFGTVIEIDSANPSPTCGYGSVGKLIGYRVIADTMNVKWHDKIDILLPQTTTLTNGQEANPAKVLGMCGNVTIKVVGHVSISEIPKTQSELASALDASTQFALAK